jgi:hypothetical protein
MQYAEAIALLDATSRANVEDRLDSWAQSSGRNRQAFENMRNESRLSAPAWEELFDAVQSAGSDLALRSEFVSIFRRHLFSGGATRILPLRLGRAVGKQRFISYLVARGYSYTVAERAVTLMMTLSPDRLNSSSVYVPWQPSGVVWATFRMPEHSQSPFTGITSSAFLGGVLGLDRNEASRLLLFEYALPTGTRALFPTIADAYAGDVWQVFFRPAPEAALHGVTMTWDELSDEETRPECVHESFSGGTFLVPVRELP